MKQTKVAVLRCRHYAVSDVKSAVLEGLSLIGFDPALLRAKKVLLKPNLLSPSPPEKAVTTHPSVVRAAAEITLDCGAAELVVGDSPGMGSTLAVLKASGIYAGLAGLPFTVANFQRPARLANPGGPVADYLVAADALECDLLVNLPKLKTHTQMAMTCAVKNMFGLVPGLAKSHHHFTAGRDNALFGRTLLDLCYLRKPALTLVDAVMAMHGNGPGSGKPYPLNLLLLGEDPAAVDMIAAQIIGIDPKQIPVLAEAIKSGPGITDREKIHVIGVKIAEVSITDFKPAMPGRGLDSFPGFIVRPLKKMLAIKPEIDSKSCKLCHECVRICPSKAMDEKGRKIRIDREACIRCFCCQEICPAGSIVPRRSLPGRILEKIARSDYSLRLFSLIKKCKDPHIIY